MEDGQLQKAALGIVANKSGGVDVVLTGNNGEGVHMSLTLDQAERIGNTILAEVLGIKMAALKKRGDLQPVIGRVL